MHGKIWGIRDQGVKEIFGINMEKWNTKSVPITIRNTNIWYAKLALALKQVVRQQSWVKYYTDLTFYDSYLKTARKALNKSIVPQEKPVIIRSLQNTKTYSDFSLYLYVLEFILLPNFIDLTLEINNKTCILKHVA